MDERRNGTGLMVLGILLALGLAVAGFFVGRGFYRGRTADRYVTVKGLSEREVAADLALLPLVFTVTGNDLGELQRRLETDRGKITGFLDGLGFTTEEYSTSAPRVTDNWAQAYGARPEQRYLIEGAVSLRSDKIDAVRQAIQRSDELVKAGVALIRSYEYNTQYLFTELDEIKPEMIAEATRDARRAAEQFAADSGSRVGAIRNAQQGYFSIEDRDAFSPEIKTVRVVTTVEYLLVDE
jgi:hypothetical protein